MLQKQSEGDNSDDDWDKEFGRTISFGNMRSFMDSLKSEVTDVQRCIEQVNTEITSLRTKVTGCSTIKKETLAHVYMQMDNLNALHEQLKTIHADQNTNTTKNVSAEKTFGRKFFGGKFSAKTFSAEMFLAETFSAKTNRPKISLPDIFR